jgi:hypothetical protein
MVTTPTPAVIQEVAQPGALPDSADTLLWRQSFDGRLGRIEASLDTRFDKLETVLTTAINNALDSAIKGFPKDDPAKHRTKHEEDEIRAEAIRKRKEEVITHLFKVGSWAVVLFICLAVWTFIKTEVQK